MKNTLLAFVGFAIVFFTACEKEDDLELQPHDSNRMMQLMHQMMDSMSAMTPANDPEIDFSRMMIMHHKGAINMANLQLQEGSNDSLKRTAQKIIAEQQKEIQEFNDILAGISPDNSVPAFSMEQMEHMMKMDAISDVQLLTGDIDNDFATLMIQHHNAAIENAEAYLRYGNHMELRALALEIIDAQQKEIQELSNWLKANRR
ncbi:MULTISPECIES: DUF305 domain-containing protein [Chitinophagaceae]|uniref:DUF305 domain-containing protein n=1 Tax=Chitinophagaceae TaxID=563835 RepID=UPI000DEF26FD|nr:MULTISPECIES: DUF305 domain-containing protein [Chitinophagaceae]RPD51138.1 DUF305 domain-containing protein [Paracnuella aquatica]